MTTEREQRSFEPRIGVALAAVLLAAPAALFFLAAVGRQLQPVAHEPARTLNAIVEAYQALPPVVAVALVLAAPTAALFLSGWVIWRALTTDDRLPGDLERLGRALRPFARRPAFVLSLVVVCTAGAMLLFLAVHAITG